MVPLPPPLIVTLKLDKQSFKTLDRVRTQHFPSQRNFLKAHVSLFHALPGAEKCSIKKTLLALCRQTAPLTLSFPSPRLLGRGVALAVVSPELENLRKELAAEWESWLSPQDRQAYRPHVTIQNKVQPQNARCLFQRLKESWQPLSAIGEGLQLWMYLRGPWELEHDFPFRKG